MFSVLAFVIPAIFAVLSYLHQFYYNKIADDVEQCRAALQGYPPGHFNRSTFLNNLANSLHIRFQQRGVPSDLDEALEVHRTALALRPPGHPDRSISLNNLASVLQTRFQ